MKYSRSEWVVVGKCTVGVLLVSALPIYVSAYVSNWSLGLATSIHAIVIAVYVGLVAVFGAGSALEMAILPVVIAIVASSVVPSYLDYQQHHKTKPGAVLKLEAANRYYAAIPPNHRLQSDAPRGSRA